MNRDSHHQPFPATNRMYAINTYMSPAITSPKLSLLIIMSIAEIVISTVIWSETYQPISSP